MQLEEIYTAYLKHPNIITDSRKVVQNCMFFALKGPNFDANAFALKAIEDGAAYAVVSDPALANNPRCIHVSDTLVALQELAKQYRSTLTMPVLAITGTNGKTTNKELIAAVLGTTYRVHFTQGNLNNHIGVPLTILCCPTDAEIAVIEMGANKRGDIKELCEIADPTHGLITNIGKAHLEGFVDLQGVKSTKSELYRYLAHKNGLVFINQSEKYLTTLAKPVKKRILYGIFPDQSTTGTSGQPQLISSEPFLRFGYQNETIQTQIAGDYNLPNVLTAIAVGAYFKVPTQQICKGLSDYTPRMNRSEVRAYGGASVFMDAYNANPSSMAAALSYLKNQKTVKKVVILGDMFELGAESKKEHQKIYTQATKVGAEILIVVGKEFGAVSRRKTDLYFETTEALKLWFGQQDWHGCFILLKGSRGMHLETIL
jgi:UDP-N-acetylmuramoyl-tripeptide--D-alanyl-D-alanine ligase